MGVAPLTVTLNNPQAKFFLLFQWLRDLSSRGRNVSTSKHNNDSIELEIKTAIWPLWTRQASESKGKEGSCGAGWGV